MEHRNPEAVHRIYPANAISEAGVLSCEDEETVWTERTTAEEITSVNWANIEGREAREGIAFDCLLPGDMLHVLLDKQRDEKDLRDCYKCVLLGRIVSETDQRKSRETSPHVQLWRPLELSSDYAIPENTVVELIGTVHYHQPNEVELQPGTIQGDAYFCISHKGAFLDIGTVSVMRIGTFKAYDDSHW